MNLGVECVSLFLYTHLFFIGKLFHYHISYSASAIRCLQAGTNWFGFDIDVVHKLQGIGLIFRMNLAKTIEPIAVIGTS